MARTKITKPEDSIAYAAFLRGINVGGRVIKMDDLKKALATVDLRDIKTIGASGNVLFTSSAPDAAVLTKSIEAGLAKKFDATISVMVRTLDQLHALIASDPFHGVTITPNTRLYITFLGAPTKPKTISIPYQSPEGNMRILRVSKTEIVSVVELTPEAGTIEAMGLIEKEFGKNITTRNWNTLKKMAY